jgi:hypothetical protein
LGYIDAGESRSPCSDDFRVPIHTGRRHGIQLELDAGDVMGKTPRIALLLAATACLLAVMVDWIAADLRRPGKPIAAIPEAMVAAPE